MDRLELRRLAMEGVNMHYEDRKASSKDLKFYILEARLKKEAGIERINLDILKTLRTLNGLADKNIISKLGDGTAVTYKLK